MSTWFVSRHKGALEWSRRQGIEVDKVVDHLNISDVKSGDKVIGSLPVNLAADVCKKGARYLHLSLKLTRELRGVELTADDMESCSAKVEEYMVTRIEEQ